MDLWKQFYKVFSIFLIIAGYFEGFIYNVCFYLSLLVIWFHSWGRLYFWTSDGTAGDCVNRQILVFLSLLCCAAARSPPPVRDISSKIKCDSHVNTNTHLLLQSKTHYPHDQTSHMKAHMEKSKCWWKYISSEWFYMWVT